MDFCQSARNFLAFGLALSLSQSAFAQDTRQSQFGLTLGFNHAYHNTNHLHVGADNSEVTTLHETGSGNDFIGGFSYAYNILPWFVYAHNRDMKQSILQRVWFGADLLFLNTTNRGVEFMSRNKYLKYYNYELQEKTIRLMFNSEIDFKSRWENVFTFIQMSAGAGRVAVKFDDYIRQGVGFRGGEIRLSSQVNYTLVYSLGAGLKFLVKPDLELDLSYLFTDFGEVETKTKSNSVVLGEPIQDRLLTSSILLNINYLF